MAVDGVEIKAGQTWFTRNRSVAVIEYLRQHGTHPAVGSVDGRPVIWAANGRVNPDGVISNLDLFATMGDWGRGQEDMPASQEMHDPLTFRCVSAKDTLERLRYTYTPDEQWRPPVGKAPTFLDGSLETSAAEANESVDPFFTPFQSPHSFTSVPGYVHLEDVLMRARDHAAFGKGHERHADATTPFIDQPMQRNIRAYGIGFSLGQASKKMEESQRLPHDQQISELLGAINYIAGTIVALEQKAGAR